MSEAKVRELWIAALVAAMTNPNVKNADMAVAWADRAVEADRSHRL